MIMRYPHTLCSNRGARCVGDETNYKLRLVARSPQIPLTLPISKPPWCLFRRVDSLSSATLQFDWEGCPVRLRTQAERGLLWHHSYTNRWRQLRTLASSLVISFSRALASLKIIYVWSVNPWQPLSTAVPNVVPHTVSCLFPLQGSIFGVLYTSMFSQARPPSGCWGWLEKESTTWLRSLGGQKSAHLSNGNINPLYILKD